ncbi:MAG: MmgE/PrpD family protein [Firmicutes bacterium]|nr:MmgE/PrpD family protein [Bacillota bacterium]
MNTTEHVEDLMITAIRELEYEDLPDKVVEGAKDRIIDVLGCLIRGWDAPGNGALVDLVKRWGGREEATILVYGERVPVANAAMVNSIIARSLDYESCLVFLGDRSVPSHITATTILTAMALSEALNLSGKEFITAVVAGDDLACRILASADYSISKPWDSTGTVNTFSATAVAGKMLGLTARQFKYALGIVLNQLGGTFQSIWEGTTSFKLMQGLAAHNGIFAAELAKAGWTGPNDLLFGPFGYYKLYTDGCTDAEILTTGLGKNFYSEATFKSYPSCRGIHPAADCILEIVSSHDVAPEKVEQITVYLPRTDTFISQPFKANEASQASTFFSLRYVMASALIRKSIKPEHFYEQSIRDETIDRFAQKVHIKKLPEADIGNLTDAEFKLARVAIKMQSGEEFTASTTAPKGEPRANPSTRSDLGAKFLENTRDSGTMPEAAGPQLLALLEQLETVRDLTELVALLRSSGK